MVGGDFCAQKAEKAERWRDGVMAAVFLINGRMLVLFCHCAAERDGRWRYQHHARPAGDAHARAYAAAHAVAESHAHTRAYAYADPSAYAYAHAGSHAYAHTGGSAISLLD